MLRQNSAIRTALGPAAFQFLEDAASAFQRLLPHTEISAWTESSRGESAARWGSEERRDIKVCIDLTSVPTIGRAIHARVARKTGVSGVAKVAKTLDLRELDLCRRIARCAATTSSSNLERSALHQGCPNTSEGRHTYFRFKKYKALTDGYRTGYVVSSTGRLLSLADLDRFNVGRRKVGGGMFPEWAENMARASTDGRCGICLTRSGDILVFGDGALRFVYRFGRWRYMNHAHIVELLRGLARVQKVPPKVVGAVTRSVYRTALDISFRRSGGLIVVLRARKHLRKLVRPGDAIGDTDRLAVDDALDSALPGQLIQGISRRVLVELASLDGALVLANSGMVLAYAAILQPKPQGNVGASEGSRTKAAIGASNYGLTVKISADGEIEVLSAGKSALRV